MESSWRLLPPDLVYTPLDATPSWILCLALSFGIDLNAMQLVFLTAIPLIASAAPITPSGAGVVEITMYGCLRAIGIASPLAVSVTALNRLIDYWLHIGLGLVAWAFRRQLSLQTWRAAGADRAERASTALSGYKATGNAI